MQTMKGIVRAACLAVSGWLLAVVLVGAPASPNGQVAGDAFAAGLDAQTAVRAPAAQSASTLYLHGSGGYVNPPPLSLNSAAPTDTPPKYKESPALNFA